MSGTVLHFADRFFARSQTFLYNLIVGLRRWRSVLAAAERLNEPEFPLGDVRFVPHMFRHRGLPWALNVVLRRTRLGDIPFQRALKRSAVNLVHAHFGDAGVRAELACRRGRVPLLVSFYGADASRGVDADPGGSRAFYRHLFQTASGLCAEGPHLAGLLERLGCPPQKLRILRIAIPVQRIPFRRRTGCAGSPVRLLHCGRFVHKKGLLVLVKALGALIRRGRTVELCVIGDGPLRPQIERAIAEEGVQSRVRLLGYQPRDVFWAELDRCDLLVAPSLTAPDGDSEGGAPTVLLEAQAAGVPCVTTDHADIPFVVLPERSAFLARQGDVDSLVERLEQALACPERWADMGQAGRRLVEENHDIPIVCSQLEAIYDELTA